VGTAKQKCQGKAIDWACCAAFLDVDMEIDKVVGKAACASGEGEKTKQDKKKRETNENVAQVYIETTCIATRRPS